jgi:hypothetical protein
VLSGVTVSLIGRLVLSGVTVSLIGRVVLFEIELSTWVVFVLASFEGRLLVSFAVELSAWGGMTLSFVILLVLLN